MLGVAAGLGAAGLVTGIMGAKKAKPVQQFYGGSQQAQQSAADAAYASSQAGANAANQALGGYGQLQGMGQQQAYLGQQALQGAVGARAQYAGPTAVANYDPSQQLAMQNQASQDMGLRNAIALGRSGPQSGLGVARAVAAQQASNVQGNAQLLQAASQAEAQRQAFQLQATGMNQQNTATYNQANLQQQQIQGQLGLGLGQQALTAQAQGTAGLAGAQLGREQFYAGQQQQIMGAGLSAAQGYEQQRQANGQMIMGLGGGLMSAGGMLGAASMMGGYGQQPAGR